MQSRSLHYGGINKEEPRPLGVWVQVSYNLIVQLPFMHQPSVFR